MGLCPYIVGSRGTSQLGGSLLGSPPGYKANKVTDENMGLCLYIPQARTLSAISLLLLILQLFQLAYLQLLWGMGRSFRIRDTG